MKTIKVEAFAMLGLFFALMVTFNAQPVKGQGAGEATIYVHPQFNNFTTPPTEIDDAFNVTVRIKNYTEVAGWGVKLVYDKELLYTNAGNVSYATDFVFPPGTYAATPPSVSSHNTTHDYAMMACGTYGAIEYSGTDAGLMTVRFYVNKTPSAEETFEALLWLEPEQTYTVDENIEENTEYLVDGYYQIRGVEALICVHPQFNNFTAPPTEIDDAFNVTVRIKKYTHVAYWQAKLVYDKELLYTNAGNVSYATDFVFPPGTYAPCPPSVSSYNTTHDYAMMACATYGAIEYSGTDAGLMTVRFYINKTPSAEETLEAILWLEPVDTYTCDENVEENTECLIDGYYQIISVGDEWYMFRHDPSHIGYSTLTAPNTNDIIWSYTTAGSVWSSPAFADNKVYVGSYDDNVYCLNAKNGEHVWNYTTNGNVWSSPNVRGGKVYFGSDDKVYCLNATTGEHIWNYTAEGNVWSSPTVVDDRVYVGSYDNKVYCLNGTTGEDIWNYATNGNVWSSPAVADGRVYIGSDDNNVYCLNATTGVYIWSYTTGDAVYSSPAIAGDKVYVGSYDNNIYCLNATTGLHIWSYTTGDVVYSSPAVAEDKIYIGSHDNKVYCLNATTGEHIWSYMTEDVIYSSPAIADGKVYVGSHDNNVYCLNATTGACIWSYTTGNPVSSSPAVAEDRIYIGSDDDKVYAFGLVTYTLTITTTSGGSTDPPPGSYIYAKGTIVEVTAIPYTNFEFWNWIFDDRVLIISNPINVTMDFNHTLHAVFNYNVTITAWCYTEGTDVSVNILMDGSSTGFATPHNFTKLTGTHNFTVPDRDPNEHLFKQWNTSETSTTITVTSGGTYTAWYSAKYILAIVVKEGGTTIPSPGNYSCWDGTQVTVRARPDTNYVFNCWELDGFYLSSQNPVTITVDANHTLHALFNYTPPPVGGIWIPTDKFGLLAPYIGLASTILIAAVATAIHLKRVKRRKEKQ